jgi:predicted DCC family thiol-disulfide oxidoreductase YuxK
MKAIVLFDGVCNFCSDSVNFIIRHDPENRFLFAPLQSDAGKELLDKYDVDMSTDSIVLIEKGQAFTRSTAALRIAKRMGGIWALAYVVIIVPRPIRDYLYDLFARYRYGLFGQKDECILPTPDVQARFL